MKIRSLALALLATALVVAGCSSAESKNEYVDTVNEIQGAALKSANAVSDAATGTDRQAAKAFGEAQEETDAAVAELNEIDVPSEAQAGHEELVAAFEALSGLLAMVREQVDKGQRVDARKVRTEETQIDKRIADAIDQINSDLGAE
ncbi:MAG: hypothetical protein M3331_08450 [Actinomycetota bacterium]|nr:hypothetical protein [Actinomycetota bacterium]